MRPVTINGGYVMRAWYDIIGTDLARREDEAGLRASRLEVEALIARERARGVAASRIVLAGFSQGCAMALMTGLRHAERLAGLVGLSGYLPLAAPRPPSAATPTRGADLPRPRQRRHGDPDARAPAPRATRCAPGPSVEWHEYPMPHSVCAEEIARPAALAARRARLSAAHAGEVNFAQGGGSDSPLPPSPAS